MYRKDGHFLPADMCHVAVTSLTAPKPREYLFISKNSLRRVLDNSLPLDHKLADRRAALLRGLDSLRRGHPG